MSEAATAPHRSDVIGVAAGEQMAIPRGDGDEAEVLSRAHEHRVAERVLEPSRALVPLDLAPPSLSAAEKLVRIGEANTETEYPLTIRILSVTSVTVLYLLGKRYALDVTGAIFPVFKLGCQDCLFEGVEVVVASCFTLDGNSLLLGIK